ncbi:2-polyprenyl-6-methoxyphenol hydroxylase [Nonomuraea maritima]|uniref:2-polyprenyl-6-methoxyphenol hydroxylase n=1 Tax=Nonomuraea maritima TaxID=683260 RepID=A0A1G9Q4N5_9ACTN|nr:FAD-dependent monooxygenase [Nonomuraea maritima]SDM06008.1 2-polyprenyl-6-methoxyphenol hydroxylase [Nonomuraea maritima]
MRARRVLISGAGIAGPALSHWLAGQGDHVTVVERAPGIRPGGQAVDFRGAPQLRVLDRMGILDAVRRAQTRMGAITIVDETGRHRSSLPSEAFSGEVEILRGDLSRILHETAADAEYHFDDSITSLTETRDGVQVTFERTAPRTFDLVVGADGIRSRVRGLAFPSPPLHHLGMYGAVFSVPGTYGLDHAGVMFSAPGRCATITSAAGRTRVALDFASPPLAYDHGDRAQQEQLIAAAFDGLGWEIPGLLDEMRRAPDFFFSPAAQVVLPRWSSGRVVLLGDAGYAPGPGGMGTGLALVAAYVLAGELATAGDHRTAFARYEDVLRPYVAVCHRQARGADRFLVPATRSRIWRRNQVLRMLPYMPGKSLIKRMTDRAAAAITLKDYPYGPQAVRARS